jgi:outer membrane receptor protein involved in Fe transport
MANRNIEHAVRVALLAASAASVGVYAPGALAQEQEIEQVIVTGSRIPQPNIEGTSPVTVLGAQEITFEGTQQVEDLINNLPQAFADQGGNISNGASGTATVNLRNLGADRTLVLVNGRRLPAGSPGGPVAPDLNQIPAQLIKRVEVLTGGASAVYGSDAVAGVVNFIMLDDFEGVQFDGNYSFYQHSNDDNFMQNLVKDSGFKKAPNVVKDGDEYSLSMTLGSNFADGKGNAVLFFGYTQTDPILQSERDYSACALGSSSSGFYCGGSSTSFPGRFRVNNIGKPGQVSYSMNPDTGKIAPWGSSYLYNYGPLNYYQRPQERYQVASFAHYDFNDSAQLYAEFMMMDNSTVAQIAPSGAFGYVGNVRCSNPLLKQDGGQWLNLLCTSAGLGPTQSRGMTIQRRNVEGGGRQDDLQLTDYRGVIGIKGAFAEHWNYDVSAQYGKNIFAETYYNDFSRVRTNRALDVVTDPSTGQPVCASFLDGTDTNCVPWNIWSLGKVSKEALNYLQAPGFARGNTNQTVVTGTVSSNLGDYGVTIPTAKDGIGIALGAEYRQEGLAYNTDVEFQTGDLAGQGGPRLPVKGSYNVMDFFAEARIPLVQDVSFVKDLTFNGSYRYSDYSTDVNTSTYGLGLDWQIIDDVKLRYSFQHAVRAPNVIELYSPSGLGLWDMAADPCSGPKPTATAAQCALTGLPASLYGQDLSNSAGQYNAIFGGSTALDPEKADTWTAGIVFTPTFVDGLSATLDYWSIKVDDTIATVPPKIALDQCLATGSSEYCSLIQRDSQGTLWLLDSAYIVATNVNIGTLETAGWDLNLNYNLTMGDWGGLSFALTGTWLDKFIIEPLPGVSKYDCAGLYGDTCGTPLPELRTRLRTTWSTPWNLDVSLNWRFFDSVDIDYSSNDDDLADPSLVFKQDKTLDSQNYLDLALVYTFAEKYTLSGGINNILDTDPPLSGFVGTGYGNGNTYPQVYDALGRYVFFGLSIKL